MKFALATILSLLTLATAQNLGAEPACATSCLSSAITAAGCQPTDVGCQCSPSGQSAIAAKGAGCLIAACTAATDLAAAESVGFALCAAYSAAQTMGSMSMTGSATATSTMASTTAMSTVTASTVTTSVASTSSMSMSTTPMTSSSMMTSSMMTSSMMTSSMMTSSMMSSSKSMSPTVTTSMPVTGSASATATTSGPAMVSKAAAMGLLVNDMGGLAAAFLAVVAAL